MLRKRDLLILLLGMTIVTACSTWRKYSFSPLVKAAQDGHVATVIKLLNEGADINEKGNGYYGYGTALMEAAEKGNIEIVRLLLDRRADVNEKNYWGTTALMYAIGWPNFYWVRKSTKITRNKEMLKTKKELVNVVKVLLKAGADVNVKTKDGRTALTSAAVYGQTDVVKVLLEAGVEVSAKSDALFWAGMNCHTDVVKVLLEAGVELSIRDKEDEDKVKLLHFAARNGLVEMINMLIDNNVSVLSRYLDDRTALMEAAIGGYAKVVKVLMEYYPNLDAKDKKGNTALSLAVQNGHIDVVKMLVASGVDVSTKNDALAYATKGGHTKIVHFLLEQGVDLSKHIGRKVFFTAVEKGHTDIVNLLLEYGMDVNMKAWSSETALMIAALCGNSDLITILLDYDADINVITKPQTSIDCDHYFNIKTGKTESRDIGRWYAEGTTALNIAAREGYNKIFKMLKEAEGKKKSRRQVSKTIKKHPPQNRDQKAFQAIPKDITPPKINITSHQTKGVEIVEHNGITTVTGIIKDNSEITNITVNQTKVRISKDGIFRADVDLDIGKNGVVVSAMDIYGNASSKTFTIIRKKPVMISLKHNPLNLQGERWAVIIGISDYQDTRIPALRYAAADAQSFYDWVISPDGGKYAPARVKLLIGQDATGKNIKNALFTWLKAAIEEDMVIIYFAGHGSPDSPDSPENLFLLPYDTQYDNIAATGFPMWDIETALKRFIKAKKAIVIADACHAGGVGQAFDIAKRTNRNIDLNPISTSLQNLSKIGDGICVISASDDKQFSQESKDWGGGHGVFTHFLLNGLKGEADYNKDSRVTLGELIPFLSEQVRRATKNAQSPIVAGKFDPALSIEK